MDTQAILFKSLIVLFFNAQPSLPITTHNDSAEHYTSLYGRFDKQAIRQDDSVLKMAMPGLTESERYYMSTNSKFYQTERYTKEKGKR